MKFFSTCVSRNSASCHSFKKVERFFAMSNLWKCLRELRRNSANVQNQPAVQKPTISLNNIVRAPDSTSWSDISLGSHEDVDIGSDIVKESNDVHHHAAQLKASQSSVPDREPVPVSAVRTPDDEGLTELVEMQQTLIVQMQQDNSDLAQRLMEKDAILAEKDKILAERESEVQILQQTALVSKYNHDLDISDMTQHFKLQDQLLLQQDGEIKRLKEMPTITEFDNFEVDYWRNIYCEQQEKFLALYRHARNLVEDRDAMVELEKKRKSIIKQQVLQIKHLNTRVASLVHEDNMEHLARQQSITTYSSSDSASVSSTRESQSRNSMQSEVDTASVSSTTRESHDKFSIDARRQDEAAGVSRMLGTVDRLARHYSPPDRYHDPNVSNMSPPRLVTDPEKLPNSVPQEMFAIWLHAHQEDLTPEEVEGFAKYLHLQIRPPPIHSPHLKKPFVNWTKVNPFQYKNLPQPSPFPIQGCSPDPEFYGKTEILNDRYYTKVVKWGRDDNKCPFGIFFGFSTNMGIVPVPAQVIHGYRCNPTYGIWQLDAKG